MDKYKLVLCLVIICIVLLSSVGEASSIILNGNKIFLKNENGYLWRIEILPVDTQGFYLEIFKISDYYQQVGVGFDFRLSGHSYGEIWSLVGLEEYRLLKTNNSFFRNGLRAQIPVSFGKIILGADVMIDDLVGSFLRYQLEVSFLKKWIRGKVGIGNLLGNKDGMALWIGFEL
ncbi:hypothetical protein BBF96_11230 [Anoxybacter fermentans]|uniref:Uncharacterized protein n=1 Tax=Anoxybacter fermentans TaxID=1323375 RepID=A0A3Q9HR57_9FIRM|nr:hypothetical protein [Anoxybacter fermentans]AZR73912.1 hypothetical protein BBF96_11230 [Anoxybacter fermentans]